MKHKLLYVYKPTSLKIMKGYAGMNADAAKVMHFKPQPKDNELLIDRTLSEGWKLRTIKHELIEKGLMDKGWDYWSAHTEACNKELKPFTKLHLKKPKASKV